LFPQSGVQVASPPQSGSPDYAAVQSYLVQNPTVKGVVIDVDWSDFDLGDATTGTHTSYDFSIIDGQIGPWQLAGKKINFVLQATPYAAEQCPTSGTGSRGTPDVGNCALPPWVWTSLSPANTAVCSSSAGDMQVPNFMSTEFTSAYKSAIQALVSHYASVGAVEYMRAGFGMGDGTGLPAGWDDATTPCGEQFSTTFGYTTGSGVDATWNAYLLSMVQFVGLLVQPNKQFFVSLTPILTAGVASNAVADFIGPLLPIYGVGVGSQELQYSDTTMTCASSDWCSEFDQFKTPLELRTLTATCPSGQCATGSLVSLVPFALAHNVDTLEVDYADWLVAYDPSNPDYPTYGASYRAVLEQAASSL
jgi:hypothetical protein